MALYGLGYIIIRSPYIPSSIYLSGAFVFKPEALNSPLSSLFLHSSRIEASTSLCIIYIHMYTPLYLPRGFMFFLWGGVSTSQPKP